MVVNIFTKQIRQQEDETGRGHTPNSLHGVISPRNEELPQLRDYPSAKREALFDQKLELCSHVFSFEDAASNKKEKEVKRQTLLELVDYVNTSAGQKIFTESSMPVCSHVLMQDITRGYSPCV
jgi:serine/threonine-protein phosphatase 2A regulatory subunit B'